MTAGSVRTTNIPTLSVEAPTPTASSWRCSETAGERLNRCLLIADDGDRETLITEAFRLMCESPKGARRNFWRDVMMALIDGRPQAEKDRLDAERLERASR